MKPFFSVLLMLALSVSAFAKPEFDLTATGKYIVIKADDWSKSDLDIQIKDIQGQVVFNHSYASTSETAGIKLNVAQLPIGNYEVVLSNDLKSQKQSFTKTEYEINLSNASKTFFKPQISAKGPTVKVNYLNLDKYATLRILDPANQVIYTADLDQMQYSKQFNLTQAGPGEYTFAITQGENQYWNTVTIK